jgi:hypothetical protein
MTGTSAACLHTNQSRSYLNHLVILSLCFGQDSPEDDLDCRNLYNQVKYCSIVFILHCELC